MLKKDRSHYEMTDLNLYPLSHRAARQTPSMTALAHFNPSLSLRNQPTSTLAVPLGIIMSWAKKASSVKGKKMTPSCPPDSHLRWLNSPSFCPNTDEKSPVWLAASVSEGSALCTENRLLSQYQDVPVRSSTVQPEQLGKKYKRVVEVVVEVTEEEARLTVSLSDNNCTFQGKKLQTLFKRL